MSSRSSAKSGDMKQSQLSFAVKRTGTAASIGKDKKTTLPSATTKPARKSSSEKPVEIKDEISSFEDESDNSEKSTIEEEKPVVEESTTPANKSVQKKKSFRAGETKTSKIQPEPKKFDVSGLLDLNIQDKRWNSIHKETKAKMGGQKAIHGKNETRINEILRVFDLTDDYGPCIGIPRLERWERAKSAGLNPPQEIYDILTTKEGVSDTQYSQTVFYGEVLE